MVKLKARDGATLSYEVHDFTDPWAKAPTLLLQHGFGRTARFWYNLVPTLARHYRVVCPTLRGLGDSVDGVDFERSVNLENYIADLDAIIDHLGVDSVHFTGESLGGVIGFVYAAERAARVRTLTTMSSPLFIDPAIEQRFAFGHASWEEALRTLGSYEWGRQANAATRFPPDTDPRMLDWYAREIGSNRVEALVAMVRFATSANATPFLERIAAPMLGIYPTTGAVTTDAQTRTLREKVRDIRIVHMPTPYHMTWMLYPAACARHILHFIAAHDGIACVDI
ncbi:MAG: alpha/beta fold hydrolase [Burkholderiales bacterium]